MRSLLLAVQRGKPNICFGKALAVSEVGALESKTFAEFSVLRSRHLTAPVWEALAEASENPNEQIAVKRLADAPSVDHRTLGHVPHERLVNMAIDRDRLLERQILGFEFRIGCVGER